MIIPKEFILSFNLFFSIMSIEANQVLAQFRDVRSKLGLTQKEVGEKLGITSNAYNRIETGVNAMTFDRFLEICKVLKINPLQLFSQADLTTISQEKLIEMLEKNIQTSSQLLNDLKNAQNLPPQNP